MLAAASFVVFSFEDYLLSSFLLVLSVNLMLMMSDREVCFLGCHPNDL